MKKNHSNFTLSPTKKNIKFNDTPKTPLIVPKLKIDNPHFTLNHYALYNDIKFVNNDIKTGIDLNHIILKNSLEKLDEKGEEIEICTLILQSFQ